MNGDLDPVGFLRRYLDGNYTNDYTEFEEFEYLKQNVDSTLKAIFEDIFSEVHRIDYENWAHANIIFDFVYKLILRSNQIENYISEVLNIFLNFNFDFTIIQGFFKYVKKDILSDILRLLIDNASEKKFSDELINFRILVLLQINGLSDANEILGLFYNICNSYINSDYVPEHSPMAELLQQLATKFALFLKIDSDEHEKNIEEIFSIIIDKLLVLPINSHHASIFEIFYHLMFCDINVSEALLLLIDPSNEYIKKLIQSNSNEKVIIMKNLAVEINLHWEAINSAELYESILALCLAGTSYELYVDDINGSANQTYYELYFKTCDRGTYQPLFRKLFFSLDGEEQESLIETYYLTENGLFLFSPIINECFDSFSDNIAELINEIYEKSAGNQPLQLSLLYLMATIASQDDFSEFIDALYEDSIKLIESPDTAEISRVCLSLVATAMNKSKNLVQYGNAVGDIIVENYYECFENKLDLIDVLARVMLMDEFTCDEVGIAQFLMVILNCAFASLIEYATSEESHQDEESVYVPDHLCSIFSKYHELINTEAYYIATDVMSKFFDTNIEYNDAPTDFDVKCAIAAIANVDLNSSEEEPVKLFDLLNEELVDRLEAESSTMLDSLRFDQALLSCDCDQSINVLFKNIILIDQSNSFGNEVYIEPLISYVCKCSGKLDSPIGDEVANILDNIEGINPDMPIIELLFQIAFEGIINDSDQEADAYTLLFCAIAILYDIPNKLEKIDAIIGSVRNDRLINRILNIIDERKVITLGMIDACVKETLVIRYLPVVAARIIVHNEELPKLPVYQLFKSILIKGLNKIGLSDAEKVIYKHLFEVLKTRTDSIPGQAVYNRLIEAIDANNLEENKSGFVELVCTFTLPDVE